MKKISTFNSRVYQYSDKLTPNEEIIAHYIIFHPKEVIRMKIEQLEEKIYVSKSSIERFCKKLGYSGFMDLKNNIKAELIESSDKVINTNFDLLKHLISDYNILLNRFLKFIEEKDIDRLIKQITSHDYIYILGLGHFSIAAHEFAFRLKRLGIKAEPITSELEMKIIITNMNERDLLIFFTNRCKSYKIIETLQYAKHLNVNVF